MFVLKASTEFFGQTMEAWQDSETPWVILGIGGLFLLGQADENANIVLPHNLVVVQTLETAQRLCRDLIEKGVK